MKTKAYISLFVWIIGIFFMGNITNATMYGNVDATSNANGTSNLTIGNTTLNLTPAQSDAIVNIYNNNSPAAAIALVNDLVTAANTWNGGGLVGQWYSWHETVSAIVTSTAIEMTCVNWATINVAYTITQSTPPTPAYTTPADTTPPPVITTSSTTSVGWSCSSYISHWIPSWSECGINSGWTPAGTITCLQTNSWAPVSADCGATTSTTTTTCVDGGCSPSTSSYCDSSNCLSSALQPAPTYDTKTVTMDLNSPTTTFNNAYANDSEFNVVRVGISGVTNQGRAITGWLTNGIFKNFSDTSSLSSNRINGGWKALNFADISSANISWAATSWYFEILPIKSRAPFVWKGTLSFQAGSTTMNLNNISYSFNKPFIWYIQTSEDNGVTWTGKSQIGTEMKHKLLLTQKSTMSWSGLSGYSLNDFSNAIQPFGAWLEMQSKSVMPSTLSSNTGTQFNARINTSDTATVLNKIPGLQINLPIITYTLWWEVVKYQLSEQDAWNDTSPIKTSGNEFLWVRVIGGIQWAGKSEFTWQKVNISSIATFEMRTELRKNAYNYTRSMQSGETVNGVKYIVGDITLSWSQDYETLVVKDGNVIITGDLNPSSKKFWIMVLKDGYDTINGFNWKGNIYIKPAVKKINAVMYADGAMVSVSNSGIPYLKDSSDRTYELRNQLFINGSLFTRNTIGGAILAGWKYILPGWSQLANTIPNFNTAMQYDLNYIRRWKVGCDTNANSSCIDFGEYSEPFIISYDARIQTSPVKLFSK